MDISHVPDLLGLSANGEKMTSTTKPTAVLDVLRKLQSMEDEIKDVRARRDEMVTNIERLRKVLGQRGEQLSEMRSKLQEAETWHAKKSAELAMEKDKLTKSKAKLTGVTRSKEYVAVNRELDTIRRNIAHREDEEARLRAAIEEFRSTIEAEDAKVSTLSGEAEAEANRNSDSLDSMNESISAVEEKRVAIGSEVSAGILKRFNRVLKAREGVAVVAISEGTCLGCNMVLQPRIVEHVLRGDTLNQCPYCSRYLYSESAHNEDGDVVASL
jgi:predicted  nucleic acid-binding Zn-ribbon protein